MADLYKDLLSNNDNSISIDESKKADASSSSSAGKKASDRSKSSSNKSKTKSSDSIIEKEAIGNDAIAKLTEVMQNGFQNMQELLAGCLSVNNDAFGNLEDVESESFVDEGNSDIFSSLTNEITQSEKLGSAVPETLATLADKLLSTNVDSLKNEKFEKHLRPGNINFLSAPQINKPIWGNLSQSAKTRDVKMQTIQKTFLASAIPTLKVMQLLHDNHDNPSQLDVKELLRTLCDSISFLGNANVDMVKARRSLIKKELPSNMQGLCQESVSFSGSNLFGDSLSSDIKEVSELNKISGQLRGRGTHRPFNVRGTGRGFYRANTRFPYKRGGFTRFNRRNNPTQPSTSRNNNLNRRGPSME